MSNSPLIVVLGPTASGKSDVALAIAEHLRGEIVNFDSLQVYRHMDIGTAKPTAEERRRVPHHLLDIVNPDEVFTAGQYSRVARQSLRELSERGIVPVLVGGTGFYLRALLEGLFPGPQADPALRARLNQRPADRLHRILKKIDSVAAERIHPNDKKKIIRAIEVCLLARKPLSHVQPQRDPLRGFRELKIGLAPPRSVLWEAINQRCKVMFERGILEETHFVVEHFGRSAKALEAIGYAEATRLLDGSLSRETALDLAQLHTRQYAKRQMTWFRKEPNVNWLLSSGKQGETMEAAIRLADDYIKDFSKKHERIRE